jgi:hypothetical protein
MVASAKRRHWADVVVILTGMVLLGLALRPGEHNANTDAAREAGEARTLWAAHAVAGAMAITSVFAAQHDRYGWLARVLLVLAGAALIGSLVLFNDFGVRAMLTMLLPGLLLLLAATSVGPMPRDL